MRDGITTAVSEAQLEAMRQSRSTTYDDRGSLALAAQFVISFLTRWLCTCWSFLTRWLHISFRSEWGIRHPHWGVRYFHNGFC